MGYTVKVFDWFIPENHDIYLNEKRSIRNVKIRSLIENIENYSICPGLSEQSSSIIHHVVPLNEIDDDNELRPIVPFKSKVYIRPAMCSVLVKLSGDKCIECEEVKKKSERQTLAKSRRLSVPAKAKAPISKTAPERVVLALQQHRLVFSTDYGQ